MGRTVDWLENNISSRELSEWTAFSQIEPFGEWRADVRSAIIARTVAQGMGMKRSDDQPITLEEFMPKFNVEQQDKLSPEKLREKARMIWGMVGEIYRAKTKGNA